MLKLSQSFQIDPRWMSRHGLISGATGSGKSVTLMRLIDQCAALGIPVLATDLKGDLSALASPQAPYMAQTVYTHPNAAEPFRVPAWSLGPDVIARMIDATTQQRNALVQVFDYLDNRGESPHTLAGIAAVLHPKTGVNLDAARGSAEAIRRKLDGLQARAGLIGEATHDFRPAHNLGGITLIEATTLGEQPRVYGALMTWLLEKLFRELPEVGDLDKPKLVVIVDEAHLLFDGLTPDLFEGVERVVRLIRSRGVGLWFASQNPQDVPPAISAQLATRIVHAMRPGNAGAVRSIIAGLPPLESGNVLQNGDIFTLPPGHAYATTIEPGGRQGLTRPCTVLEPRVPLGAVQPIPTAAPRPIAVTPGQRPAASGGDDQARYTPTQKTGGPSVAAVADAASRIAALWLGAWIGQGLAWLPFAGDTRTPHLYVVIFFCCVGATAALAAYEFAKGRIRWT